MLDCPDSIPWEMLDGKANHMYGSEHGVCGCEHAGAGSAGNCTYGSALPPTFHKAFPCLENGGNTLRMLKLADSKCYVRVSQVLLL